MNRFPGIKIPVIKYDEVCSLILSVFLSLTAMSLYGDSPVRSFLICLGFTLVSVVVCHFVNRYRFFGTFGIIIYLILYFMLMMRFISGGEDQTGVYFWQWMVSGGDEATLEIEAGSGILLRYGMYMAVTLFFAITIYYFSVPTYRFGYLTLISLMPFILYAKVTMEVENKYLALVVLASVLLHMVCSRKVAPTRQEYKQAKKESTLLRHKEPVHYDDWNIHINGKGAYYIGFAAFVIVILIFSALIPKRHEAKYYDKFEDLFLGGDTDSDIDESFSGLADFSGNADNFREGSNRRLYIVLGDTSRVYLKRQVFDLYDFEKDRWYIADSQKSEADFDEWFSAQKLLSASDLVKALQAAEELEPGLFEKHDIRDIEGANVSDPVMHYSLTAQNFEARYYLSAARIIRLSLPSSEDPVATPKGTLYRREGTHAKDITYSLDVHNPASALREFTLLGMVDMSAEESLSLLRDAESALVEKAKLYEENEELLSHIAVISAFKNDLISAMIYRDNTAALQAGIPDEISSLAAQITSGCRNDAEKATALEKYFRENDFLYDIRYRAPDDSPVYFLTEGKTGTCSDFASAFVLMSRSAGLMVRYTEGFVPGSSMGELYQTITESDSHAYAEVFIENIGWIPFDPTAGVRNVDSGSFWDLLKSLRVDYGLIRVLMVLAVIVAGIILMFKLFIPLLTELFFRISLNFRDPAKSAGAAFRRLVRKAGKNMGSAYRPTPGEFADMAASRGFDISSFIILLEKSSYGCLVMYENGSGKKNAVRIIKKGYADASKAVSRRRNRETNSK